MPEQSETADIPTPISDAALHASRFTFADENRIAQIVRTFQAIRTRDNFVPKQTVFRFRIEKKADFWQWNSAGSGATHRRDNFRARKRTHSDPSVRLWWEKYRIIYSRSSMSSHEMFHEQLISHQMSFSKMAAYGRLDSLVVGNITNNASHYTLPFISRPSYHTSRKRAMRFFLTRFE